MKLSEVQKEVISRLQNNEIIHYMRGFDARCFYSNDVKRNLKWSTILKLEDLGLIKRNENYVVLTDEGANYVL